MYINGMELFPFFFFFPKRSTVFAPSLPVGLHTSGLLILIATECSIVGVCHIYSISPPPKWTQPLLKTAAFRHFESVSVIYIQEQTCWVAEYLSVKPKPSENGPQEGCTLYMLTNTAEGLHIPTPSKPTDFIQLSNFC